MSAKTNSPLILLDLLFAFKSIEQELITAAISSSFKEGKHLVGGNKKVWFVTIVHKLVFWKFN